MAWLLLALLPLSALFSALSLAIAAFARSSKEGQYYLMPLLLITLPLMISMRKAGFLEYVEPLTLTGGSCARASGESSPKLRTGAACASEAAAAGAGAGVAAGDGAAAAILTGNPNYDDCRSFHGFDTHHVPVEREKIRFVNSAGKLKNQLHRSVPELAAKAVSTPSSPTVWAMRRTPPSNSGVG